MTVGRVFCAVVIAVAVFLGAALGIRYGAKSAVDEFESTLPPAVSAEEPSSEVLTYGNRSYIPLGYMGSPSSHAMPILRIIAFFEETRDVEVTSFSIDGQQESSRTKPYIYGIWVTHRPKP